MKKILLILVVALGLTTAATAQNGFKKSDVFVEGTFSYEKSEGQDANYTINPTLGYFLTDKVALGIAGGTGNFDGDKVSNLGVFGRYYFLNLGQNFKVYSQLGGSVNNNPDEDYYLSADLGLGLNYFVTKNLALTTSVTKLASYNDRNDSSYFNVGFNGVDNPFNKPTFGLLYKF